MNNSTNEFVLSKIDLLKRRVTEPNCLKNDRAYGRLSLNRRSQWDVINDAEMNCFLESKVNQAKRRMTTDESTEYRGERLAS